MSNNAYVGPSSVSCEGNFSGPLEMGRVVFLVAWKSTFHSIVPEYFLGPFYLASTVLAVAYSRERDRQGL